MSGKHTRAQLSSRVFDGAHQQQWNSTQATPAARKQPNCSDNRTQARDGQYHMLRTQQVARARNGTSHRSEARREHARACLEGVAVTTLSSVKQCLPAHRGCQRRFSSKSKWNSV
ncbi:hypothetical protein TRVL_07542 [Trypanosoma vivax]|nr:hypothetical protein TRVL_07542 [Trypanosoma vivax]